MSRIKQTMMQRNKKSGKIKQLW